MPRRFPGGGGNFPHRRLSGNQRRRIEYILSIKLTGKHYYMMIAFNNDAVDILKK
jgi:hypothetical protein